MTPAALCMIVRDEADTLEQAIASARPFVAEINVLDTGSTDSTLEILDRIATEPGAPIRVEQAAWVGFAPARERAFAMSSLDWLMWLDADETLIGGEHLPRLIAAAVAEGVDCVKTVMVVGSGEPGVPSSTYFQERLVRRESGRWEGLAHARWSTRLQPSLYAHPAAVRVAHKRPLSPAARWLPLGVRSAELHRDGFVELGVDLYESGDATGAANVLGAYLATADPASFESAQSTALSWLERSLRQLGRAIEADQVNTTHREYRQLWREATWRGEAPDMDIINALDSMSPALVVLRAADPVLGVA